MLSFSIYVSHGLHIYHLVNAFSFFHPSEQENIWKLNVVLLLINHQADSLQVVYDSLIKFCQSKNITLPSDFIGLGKHFLSTLSLFNHDLTSLFAVILKKCNYFSLHWKRKLSLLKGNLTKSKLLTPSPALTKESENKKFLQLDTML